MKFLDHALTVVLLAVAAMLVAERFSGQRGAEGEAFVEDWEEVLAYTQSLSSEGRDATAPITVVEFIDLQCPFCARAHASVDSIVASHAPGVVDVRMVHFPLESIHPEATSAAVAVECAARQGRLKEMVAATLEWQQSFDSIQWSTPARQAGVANLEEFDRCVALPADSFPLIQGGLEMARSFGLTATPTFWLNGWDVPYTSLRQRVDSAVAEESR